MADAALREPGFTTPPAVQLIKGKSEPYDPEDEEAAVQATVQFIIARIVAEDRVAHEGEARLQAVRTGDVLLRAPGLRLMNMLGSGGVPGQK